MMPRSQAAVLAAPRVAEPPSRRAACEAAVSAGVSPPSTPTGARGGLAATSPPASRRRVAAGLEAGVLRSLFEVSFGAAFRARVQAVCRAASPCRRAAGSAAPSPRRRSQGVGPPSGRRSVAVVGRRVCQGVPGRVFGRRVAAVSAPVRRSASASGRRSPRPCRRRVRAAVLGRRRLGAAFDAGVGAGRRGRVGRVGPPCGRRRAASSRRDRRSRPRLRSAV